MRMRKVSLCLRSRPRFIPSSCSSPSLGLLKGFWMQKIFFHGVLCTIRKVGWFLEMFSKTHKMLYYFYKDFYIWRRSRLYNRTLESRTVRWLVGWQIVCWRSKRQFWRIFKVFHVWYLWHYVFYSPPAWLPNVLTLLLLGNILWRLFNMLKLEKLRWITREVTELRWIRSSTP